MQGGRWGGGRDREWGEAGTGSGGPCCSAPLPWPLAFPDIHVREQPRGTYSSPSVPLCESTAGCKLGLVTLSWDDL